MKKAGLFTKLTMAIGTAALLFCAGSMDSEAATRYESDGQPHAEGYILVGESHMVLSSQALNLVTDASGKIPGTNDAYYRCNITREYVAADGTPDMFVFRGNVFMVFEGNEANEGSTQTHKDYVKSNGAGVRGKGTEKIFQIMAANPNIAHWNIISWQGHAAISLEDSKGSVAKSYLQNYTNWIKKDFPQASVYFLSHGVKTKYYRGQQYAGKTNEILQKNFPDKFLDYRAFLDQNVNNTVDVLHYSNSVYSTLLTNVIKDVESRRAGAAPAAPAVPAIDTAVPGLPAPAPGTPAPAAPAAGFDPLQYAAANPDLIQAGINDPEKLMMHYALIGQYEGRRTAPY